MKHGFGWKRDRLDWRDHKYIGEVSPNIQHEDYDLRPLMPPIYDQGETNTCVANAVAAAMHYNRRMQSLPEFTPSRLFIYWCARDLEGDTSGDEGTETRDAIKSVAKFGAPPEDHWEFDPDYITVRPSNMAFEAAKKDKLLQYSSVPQKLDHILSCLKHRGPVLFGSSVFSAISSPEVEQSGVIPMPSPREEPQGGHVMLIVGWLHANKKFIIRNSWSSRWGDHGYGYMDEAYILNPELTNDLWVTWMTSRG